MKRFTSHGETRSFRWIFNTLWMILAAWVLGGTTGSAGASPPTIFHSPTDDGTPAAAGTATLSPGSSQPIHLYYSTGAQPSTAGTPCVDGNGDEVCAVDVVIERFGGSELLSFTPAGDVVFALSSTSLRFNAGNPLTGSLGTVKLGDLSIDTSGPGSLAVSRADAVSADLELLPVAPSVLVTVPEPSQATGILSGVAFLVGLTRRRSRIRECERTGLSEPGPHRAPTPSRKTLNWAKLGSSGFAWVRRGWAQMRSLERRER